MTQEESYKITNNDYMDIIIEYNRNQNILKTFEKYSVHIMNEGFAVIYIPVSEVDSFHLSDFGYDAVPNIYTLSSEQSLEASGVYKIRSVPKINLRGKGVVVGIMDTGIDYTNPVFRNNDGTTRILSIWDQTIQSGGETPIAVGHTFYGTEYVRERINEALQSPNPLEVVPSIDEVGHGTKLAGIAAGSEDEMNGFSGVAPDVYLVIVKLKPAKDNLKDLYVIPQDKLCYQENDLLWAMDYILYTVRNMDLPLSICIGLGTSIGAHECAGSFNTLVSLGGDTPKVAVSVAAGNEGNAKRHFYSKLNPTSGAITVDLNVGNNEYGFTMELWGDPPLIYSMDILSPSGEYKPVLSERLVETQTIRFIFDQTVIYVNYVLIEQNTGKQVIILRFRKPSAGLWRFHVNGKGNLAGAFHMWLPAGDLINANTYFIQSDSHTTVTSPGNCYIPITVTAYNSDSGILYPNSGKGLTPSGIFKPTLAAPGVNLPCPSLDHGFTTLTGTSAAAAHMTGICAMLLEWCVVKNNYPDIDTNGLKKFLIRGANRSKNLSYPNPDWGYGIVDVYNTFYIFRTDIL